MDEVEKKFRWIICILTEDQSLKVERRQKLDWNQILPIYKERELKVDIKMISKSQPRQKMCLVSLLIPKLTLIHLYF